jgi:hypothetical protein
MSMFDVYISCFEGSVRGCVRVGVREDCVAVWRTWSALVANTSEQKGARQYIDIAALGSQCPCLTLSLWPSYLFGDIIDIEL